MMPILLALLLPGPALSLQESEVRVASTAELRRALLESKPGARILVSSGEYEGFSCSGIRGEPAKPIVLTAADANARPVFTSGVQLSDVAHLELSCLEIRGAAGNGLNIDDGGTFETPSHHVVVRNVMVRDCGGAGNHDGIKLSGVDDFRLDGCQVGRWGRGGSAVDMVGCHRGLLEGCTFRDREEDPAATGVQAKGGACDVTLRGCRFEHAGTRAVNLGGSTGLEYFRPRPEGFEARNVAVEGCTFVGSTAPIAFVGVDGASVRWNTFYRPRKWCLRILQETRGSEFAPCRNGVFADNLVAYRASEVAIAVNVGPGTAPETFRFARNYWFCIDDPGRSPPQLPVAEEAGVGGADPHFRDVERGDFGLRDDSPARAQGAGALPAVSPVPKGGRER
jgi:parallel beta helix pectate lyase-like protein